MFMKKICFIVSTPLIVKHFLKNNFKILSKEVEIYLVGNFNNEELILFKKYSIKQTHVIPIVREINLFYDIMSLFKLFNFFL